MKCGFNNGNLSHPSIRVRVPTDHDIEVALLESIDYLSSPGPFYATFLDRHLLHSLMTHPLLRVWEINGRFEWLTLVVVSEGLGIFDDITHG